MADTIGSMQLDAIKAPLFREVKKGEVRKHLITLTVRNELGVLARIATLIAGKGYNIEGLSVGETHEKGISRMTLEVIGDDVVIDQVVKQLRKLIDTIKVKDLTDIPHVERELALIKVHTATPRARDEVLRLVEIFRASSIISLTSDGFSALKPTAPQASANLTKSGVVYHVLVVSKPSLIVVLYAGCKHVVRKAQRRKLHKASQKSGLTWDRT